MLTARQIQLIRDALDTLNPDPSVETFDHDKAAIEVFLQEQERKARPETAIIDTHGVCSTERYAEPFDDTPNLEP